MTKETTKTLAQGRKGRGGRLIVPDRQRAQVSVSGFLWSHASLIEYFSDYISTGSITVRLGMDIVAYQ